jgi:hypothetical protein
MICRPILGGARVAESSDANSQRADQGRTNEQATRSLRAADPLTA